MNSIIQSARRLVVKVGSALLVEPGGGVREAWLDGLAQDTAHLVAAARQRNRVVDHVDEDRHHRDRPGVRAPPEELHRDLQAVVDLAWRDLSSPIFFAALELWVAARTDAELRATLVPEQDRLLASMRELLFAIGGP